MYKYHVTYQNRKFLWSNFFPIPNSYEQLNHDEQSVVKSNTSFHWLFEQKSKPNHPVLLLFFFSFDQKEWEKRKNICYNGTLDKSNKKCQLNHFHFASEKKKKKTAGIQLTKLASERN